MEFMYWNNCLIKISLDCIMPVYEIMGLELSDKSKFQKLLKSQVNRHLQNEKKYPWLSKKVYDLFLFEINEKLTERDYKNFVCFATSIFETSNVECLSWKYWKDSFQKFLYPEKYYLPILKHLKLEKKRVLLKEAFENDRAAKDSYSIYELYSIRDKKSFSAWDKKILDIATLPDDDFDTDFFLDIDFTIDNNIFQLFWEKYVSPLHKDELEELYLICNSLHLSTNTADKIYKFRDEDGKEHNMNVPGKFLSDLTKPSFMRRCITNS